MSARAALAVVAVGALAGGCKQDPAANERLGHHEAMHQGDQPAVTPRTQPAAPRPRPAQLTRVTIKALGMYCEESCPLKVRYALANVPAVYELGFDLSTESIFVSYDATLGPPKQVTKPMLVAIKGAGFDPWLAKESWPEGATAQVVDASSGR